ncbi:MAG: cytochrome P450 [Acidimicrobiia bacterium]
MLDPRVPGAFLARDYFEQLAALRRDGAAHAIDDDVFLVPRYEDVRAISKDPTTFCSSRGVLVNDPLRTPDVDPAAMAGSVLHTDPPAHREYRTVVNREFTPRGVAHFEPRIRQLAAEVLDATPPEATVDAVAELAAPFPVQVIAELLGVEDGDRDDFRRWSDAMIEAPDTDDAEVLATAGELWRFLDEHLRDRARTPREDLVSMLVHAPFGGRTLSHGEARMFCLSLLVAGNETTRHLISGALLALWEHPDQRGLLAREPDRIDSAVEECLRWVTPIQAFGRTATRDTRIGDVAIPRDAFVIMLYASANRDEAAFGPTADRFDVTRAVDPPHLAFGFGEHLCLGAALARLEARIFLAELLARTPEWDVVGPADWAPSTLVRGMRSLPIRRATMTA